MKVPRWSRNILTPREPLSPLLNINPRQSKSCTFTKAIVESKVLSNNSQNCQNSHSFMISQKKFIVFEHFLAETLSGNLFLLHHDLATFPNSDITITMHPSNQTLYQTLCLYLYFIYEILHQTLY